VVSLLLCPDCQGYGEHYGNCPSAEDDGPVDRHAFLMAAEVAISPYQLHQITDWSLEDCTKWWRKNRINLTEILKITEHSCVWRRRNEFNAQDALWNNRYAGKPAGSLRKGGKIVVKYSNKQYILSNWLRKHGYDKEADWIEARELDPTGDTAGSSASLP